MRLFRWKRSNGGKPPVEDRSDWRILSDSAKGTMMTGKNRMCVRVCVRVCACVCACVQRGRRRSLCKICRYRLSEVSPMCR
eukprot:COSAG03_NODE_920_length_5316_cov_6.634848_8_plen_81_part_00